uniref:TSA: Wollemia nobilis Ref_Wollemi_Transcript_13270_2450 transcribed RNA sequence n=1 Tax=Wollemia nobilis TaxID=56998 RepID=A0A0C9QR38_9CONI
MIMVFNFYFCSVFCFALFLSVLATDTNDDRKSYIVYMGNSRHKSRESLVRSHQDLLSSVLGSRNQAQQSLVHSYTYAFTGFSAVISAEQANALAEKPGVVSVFPDPVLNLHTTQSWQFLQMESNMGGGSDPIPTSSDKDAIVGLLDTGVWPESPSFSDKGIASVPSRWKGACMQGKDFTLSNCNNKLIGARYYKLNAESQRRLVTVWTKSMTPRDANGHGTHTASTAGGNVVENANYYGLANGTARGGAPTARIAMYRVCSEDGCQGSQILAGFDDAVNDGVDVLSVSLGHSGFYQIDYTADPIAIGAFHAAQKGILVVCSAGNDGPSSQTVVNAAPWIFTVGATTINREYGSNVVLGNNKILQGEGINFSNLSRSSIYPLVYGGSIPNNSSSSEDASNCSPGSLNASTVKGKIVLCLHGDTGYLRLSKKNAIKSIGGLGIILVDDGSQKSVATNYGTFPATSISNKSAEDILSYIKSTGNPVTTITATETINNYKPAPVVAFFSSRGPGGLTQNILKPDIGAPGVNILASWIPTNGSSDVVPAGMKPSEFNIISGTSMACPHVSGAAAFLKTVNPTWSLSAIRSALITTATPVNNMGNPMTKDSDIVATPFDYGAGEVNPMAALQPGLVYETENEDYFHFLCNSGLDSKKIKAISGNDNYTCPSDSTGDLISNMNYPTIAISKLDLKGNKSVIRTVANVSPDGESTYKLSIAAPPGLNVKVSPDALTFSKATLKLSFNVTFTPVDGATKGYVFGSLTWDDGEHNVRTPFAINIV